MCGCVLCLRAIALLCLLLSANIACLPIAIDKQALYLMNPAFVVSVSSRTRTLTVQRRRFMAHETPPDATHVDRPLEGRRRYTVGNGSWSLTGCRLLTSASSRLPVPEIPAFAQTREL